MPKVSHGCETKKAHADPRPTKSDGDSVYAKQTERLLKCKGGGAGLRNSAVLEGYAWRGIVVILQRL